MMYYYRDRIRGKNATCLYYVVTSCSLYKLRRKATREKNVEEL